MLNFSSTKKIENLNIEELPTGTYFINIISETKNKTIKFEKK